jgi:hypothetical protein
MEMTIVFGRDSATTAATAVAAGPIVFGRDSATTATTLQTEIV